jgi:hypothetical protein
VIYFDIFYTFQGAIKEFLKIFLFPRAFQKALENEFHIPRVFKEFKE